MNGYLLHDQYCIIYEILEYSIFAARLLSGFKKHQALLWTSDMGLTPIALDIITLPLIYRRD